MCIELELLDECKLHKLFAGENKQSVLEASGVYANDESICHVIFDNRNQVGRVDLSLKSKDENRLIPVLNVGVGFEDITFDPRNQRYYLIIEALKDGNKNYHGLVSEYDSEFRFRRCTLLDPPFKKRNKGFEGVEHFWRDGIEHLAGLCEDSAGRNGSGGTGRVYLFRREADGTWSKPRQIDLPSSAKFIDYAAIAQRESRVAVVSQESQRVWLGEINEACDGFAESSGNVYRFPSGSYCNVEGLSWISDDRLVMVSDRRKKDQKKCCKEKDQSIHLFRIPAV